MLPAAVSLRKQGDTQGATTAFMISTPESGVDSIAVTWAMMDPVMTVARPVAAFFTAFVAGIAENLFAYRKDSPLVAPDLPCPVDGCCDGVNCDPQVHRNHHSFYEKLRAGIRLSIGGSCAGRPPALSAVVQRSRLRVRRSAGRRPAGVEGLDHQFLTCAVLRK